MPEGQIHEDIKWLESQLEAKKKELAGTGLEEKEEREMVKDVLRESISGAPSLDGPPVLQNDTSAASDDDLKKTELTEKEHAKVIEKLIEIAFAKSLAVAIKAARSLKNAHLLDEFHDTLADQYYEKLKAARKLR